MKRTALSLALLLVAACGHSNQETVSMDRLPREGRYAIFEAENAMMLERINRDETRRQVAERRAALDDLSSAWSRAKSRLKAAGKGDRIGPAEKVLDARRDYHEAALKTAQASLNLSDAEVRTAEARTELVKARQQVRFGLVPETTAVAREKTVKRREASADKVSQRLGSLREREQKAFDAWKNAEEEYAKASGDFDTLVWIDL